MAEPNNSELYQAAFHEAFRADLYRVLDSLPSADGDRVLDVPCGDGFYTARLAERVRGRGALVAVDNDEKCLAKARATLKAAGLADAAEVRQADAYHMPFADGTFDLVWCAESLITLDPAAAVREMARVTKPDGLLVILESDEFHHALVSWPAELEAGLAQATYTANLRRSGDAVKQSPARRLRRVLREAGCRDVRRVTHAADRHAPFEPPTTEFLRRHFAHLRERVVPDLAPHLQESFSRLTDPASGEALFRDPDAELTCVSAVYLARPPAGPPRSQ